MESGRSKGPSVGADGQSDDSAKDHALRRDVRSLGALLGRVLVEQAGQELFDTVEELTAADDSASRTGPAQGGAARLGNG